MTPDEYAVLVLKSETRAFVRRDDGTVDWVDATERSQLLRDARASYQAAYDEAIRAHGAAVRDYEDAPDGDPSRDMEAWEAALEAHYRRAPSVGVAVPSKRPAGVDRRSGGASGVGGQAPLMLVGDTHDARGAASGDGSRRGWTHQPATRVCDTYA